MAAPKGNDFKTKYKTSKERKELCRKLCDHLAEGLSIKCFCDCSTETLYRYMREYPEDLEPERIREAKQKGRKFWESV